MTSFLALTIIFNVSNNLYLLSHLLHILYQSRLYVKLNVFQTSTQPCIMFVIYLYVVMKNCHGYFEIKLVNQLKLKAIPHGHF